MKILNSRQVYLISRICLKSNCSHAFRAANIESTDWNRPKIFFALYRFNSRVELGSSVNVVSLLKYKKHKRSLITAGFAAHMEWSHSTDDHDFILNSSCSLISRQPPRIIIRRVVFIQHFSFRHGLKPMSLITILYS